MKKEAFFYKVPTVTLRNETEWVELVKLGWNYFQPPEKALAVADEIRQILIPLTGREIKLYGDGNAACKVVETLLKE